MSVYDRRKLSLFAPSLASSVADSCPAILSFCPEHLLCKADCYATYAEFSPCGNYVLASYHSDHSYVFPLFDVKSSGVAAPNYVCSSDSAAPFSWRNRNNTARSLREKVNLAKEMLDVGLKAVDIGLNTTSYNMFTRAIDISVQAMTLRNSKVTYRAAGAASDSQLLEQTTKVFSNALINRAHVCEKRGFVGDDVVGLSDLQHVLLLQPNDIEVLVKKAKFLLNLQRPQDALVELNRIVDLRHIDSNQLIYIQNEIDDLRAKATFALLDREQMRQGASISSDIDVIAEKNSSLRRQKRRHHESSSSLHTSSDCSIDELMKEVPSSATAVNSSSNSSSSSSKSRGEGHLLIAKNSPHKRSKHEEVYQPIGAVMGSRIEVKVITSFCQRYSVAIIWHMTQLHNSSPAQGLLEHLISRPIIRNACLLAPMERLVCAITSMTFSAKSLCGCSMSPVALMTDGCLSGIATPERYFSVVWLTRTCSAA